MTWNAEELEKAGFYQVTAPFPKDGGEESLLESWIAGVVRSYVPTAGVDVVGIEDDGPLMWLFYELGRLDVNVEVRVAEQGFWRISTRNMSGFGDERVITMIVRGPTLLACLAQAMEWWGERVAAKD